MLNPWLIIGVLVLMAGAFVAGVKVESDHRDAQLLTQERADHEAFVAEAGRLRGNADAVSTALNDSEAARRLDLANFQDQLRKAKRDNQLAQVQCPAAGSAAAAQPVVSLNVGVWNSALAAGKPAAGGDPRSVDGAAGGAAFAPLADAYDNLGENGARWGRCRDQVKGWQNLARRNGWVTDAPAPRLKPPAAALPGSSP